MASKRRTRPCAHFVHFCVVVHRFVCMRLSFNLIVSLYCYICTHPPFHQIDSRLQELLAQNGVVPPHSPERLRVFRPYHSTALKNIVTARIGPHVIHGSALTLLQKKVEANSGDARRSLDLVRHAVSVAADELALLAQQQEQEGSKSTAAASSSSSSSSFSSGLQQEKKHAFPLVTMAHVKKSIELHAKGNGSSDRAAPALLLPLMAQVTTRICEDMNKFNPTKHTHTCTSFFFSLLIRFLSTFFIVIFTMSCEDHLLHLYFNLVFFHVLVSSLPCAHYTVGPALSGSLAHCQQQPGARGPPSRNSKDPGQEIPRVLREAAHGRRQRQQQRVRAGTIVGKRESSQHACFIA